MRYYIADCHFFHGALNEKMDRRGFETVEKMNEYMIYQWNSRVRNNDEVIILGDLSWGTADETKGLLEQLKGKLYLIEGNHDRYRTSKAYETDRFEWIKPYEELHDNKRKVVLCHYPIMCYNGQYSRDAEGNPKAYMLYGHVHNTFDQRLIEQFRDITENSERMGFDGQVWNIPSNMINCFCMYSDYVPLTLDEWIENDRKRRNICKEAVCK